MAIRSIVESDLSGKPDAATATFGLGDTWYEIDLTAEEQKKLEEALKPYLKVSRKAGKTPPKQRVVPETTAEERDRIREWAKKEGYDLAERGRITKKVMKAYDEAHGIDRSK
ncbi:MULTISPECIES: Lsr2 family protein [unclassified Streptomyces]|uniref:histone-like nucleoid-structuring protein Lsr2 n=1 Tax=unclassified Streptomyces TaxID=2593676 RepID=UPI0022586DB6|nr:MULTISPECIES: Lsr2 family protein [unclassified Streptomyces]MCX4405880.1 Lsr2 family protein [Streptomyces sp. NBC_01764]MCX5189597.1 Lsr2 family protein [Streptomyces sp. NBC_00268]